MVVKNGPWVGVQSRAGDAVSEASAVAVSRWNSEVSGRRSRTAIGTRSDYDARRARGVAGMESRSYAGQG